MSSSAGRSYIAQDVASNPDESGQSTQHQAGRPAKKQKLSDGTATFQHTATTPTSRSQGHSISGSISIRGRSNTGPRTSHSIYTVPSTPAGSGISRSTTPGSQLTPTESLTDLMSDGSMSKRSSQATASANREAENEARALRVLEIMNDFRTLQVHITSLTTRAEASPPDQSAYYLDGYVVLRQCSAEGQAILATHYNPGSIGIEPGQVSDSEKQKATLQRYILQTEIHMKMTNSFRIILDASTRRFQAHKIYLRAAAGMRWVQLRKQALSGNLSPNTKATAMSRIDQRLREVRSYSI